jgi:hypothetical protein
MASLWQVGIPALIGLLGTLVGLWIGHRRWAVEHRLSMRRAYDAKRHVAYETLWNLVESSHAALRTSVPTPGQVQELQRSINKFRMESSIHIDDADAQLAQQYFEAAVELGERVAASGSREWQERYDQTFSNVQDVLEVHSTQNALANAASMVSDLRAQLITRVRDEILKTSYAVSKE